MIRVEITSYNSYEWTSELSTGETYLSTGEMHLIKDTKIIHHVVEQGPCDGLSTRTSRTSGQHHCRLEKRTCRVEKCISLRTLRNYPSCC